MFSEHHLTFTEPPPFQRNRLTGSGTPSFESCVEGKAQQREIELYSGKSSVVVWKNLPTGGPLDTQTYPRVNLKPPSEAALLPWEALDLP